MKNSHTKALIGALAALLLLGGCSDQAIKLSRAPLHRQDTLSAKSDVPRGAVSAPNHDFSDARVAGMQYAEIERRLELVQKQLQKSSQKAKGGQLFGVAQMKSRAQSVRDEVAMTDGKPEDWADPRLVRDVLEVQVETSELQDRLDF